MPEVWNESRLCDSWNENSSTEITNRNVLEVTPFLDNDSSIIIFHRK